MPDTNMLKYFVALADAVRDGGDVSLAADTLEREFGSLLTYDTEGLSEFIANNDYEDREILANGIADIMSGQEGFGAEIFRNYATGVYRYPHSPRTSWIVLAEAVNKYPGPNRDDEAQQINEAIDRLPMADRDRLPLIETLGSLRSSGQDTRSGIAVAFAAILNGREKFDTGRFVFHATSTDENDKWKYNELHPETAMKTTIESGDETVIVL